MMKSSPFASALERLNRYFASAREVLEHNFEALTQDPTKLLEGIATDRQHKPDFELLGNA